MDENDFSGPSWLNSVNFFAENSTISYLSMKKCRIGPYILDTFANGLSRNKGIQNLILKNNNLGKEGIIGLATSMLNGNNSLKFLDLRRCKVDDDGF